jgi:hypothetical protein
VSVHEAMKNWMYIELSVVAKDARQFVSRPIPMRVWGSVKGLQNKESTAFVEARKRYGDG